MSGIRCMARSMALLRTWPPATVAAYSSSSEIARSIALGKDECHVVDLLRGKILSILLYLGKIHAHAF
jgi:hypothetical protein